MDLKVGLSVFNKQWLIEPTVASQMLDYWMNAEGRWDYKEAAGSTPVAKFFAKQTGVAYAPSSNYALTDFSFEGASIAVIPVSGPLMKADNCGDLGTASLKMLTQMASNTPSVHTIIYPIDSPGGTVDGTKALADAIKESPKRTVCLADGYMCSAAYWIGSSCDKVYASGVTDIIGSIGTMCSIMDSTAALEKKGYVLREYYATASGDKNKTFSDAAKGDGKQLIAERLDPLNDVFLGAVKSNRPGVDASTLSGKTYLAEEAAKLGLIDGIASMDEIISTAMRSPGQVVPKKSNSFNSVNTTKMTASEIKAAHPEAYAEIVRAATMQERDRIGTWMLYGDVDLKAVQEGIESGEAITGKQQHELMLKKFSGQTLTTVKTDNTPVVNTPAVEANGKTEAQMQADAILAQARKNLGIKK